MPSFVFARLSLVFRNDLANRDRLYFTHIFSLFVFSLSLVRIMCASFDGENWAFISIRTIYKFGGLFLSFGSYFSVFFALVFPVWHRRRIEFVGQKEDVSTNTRTVNTNGITFRLLTHTHIRDGHAFANVKNENERRISANMWKHKHNNILCPH